MSATESADVGEEMHAFVRLLYPICRSITGPGVRETLRLIGERIPLALHQTPSGEAAFDWTIPPEWTLRSAWVKDEQGRTLIDAAKHTLHVVSYSRPIRARMSRAELDAHLHSDPDHPDWIPYRTSYYQENWGFCLSQKARDALGEGPFEVCVDATLAPGALSWGEFVLPGMSEDEFLLSVHICHPSLANDNLSGVAVACALARRLMALSARRYSYRFLFIPGTIGSINWLARNQAQSRRVRAGLVAANLGDSGPMHYKRSRRGDAEIDQIVEYVLSDQPGHGVMDFSPYGYDERQYCSPGFDLPVGCLMRTPHGRFPEYHTSADNPEFVRPEALAHSLDTYWRVVGVLERNRHYLNQNPHCEPQLGKRGLYDALGGRSDAKARQMAMLWTLNLSDGRHSLLDIARRSGLAFELLADVAETLTAHGLLAERA